MADQHTIPFDSGDADSVKDRNAAIKGAVARRRLGLRAILEDPNSRAYLWDLMAFCKIFQSTMTGNSFTYFNEGMRNVGLRIMADINGVDPAFLTRMMTENGEKNERTDSKPAA
jgi:hypothetical protein